MKHDLTSTSTDAIKRFVRGTLGCRCPGEVFDTIEVTRSPAWFAGLPADYLISIGNRLLVLVVDTAAWKGVVPYLDRLLLRGRALRDAGGYNRFRLVIALQRDAPGATPVPPQCEPVLSGDPRVHLHIVQSNALPDLQIEPARRG